MLETLTQDEIDRIESNGSTALHTAAFHGHADIVRLLLESGADRAIKNKFQCLPFDEAADDETKELFLHFYNVLNAETAGGANKYQREQRYIIALLIHHPSLDSLTFIRISYRVMQVNEHSLQKYEVNRLSMTKSFLSSSIDEKIAAWFISRYETAQQNTRLNKDGKSIKSWIMCKYQIKHRRTAFTH